MKPFTNKRAASNRRAKKLRDAYKREHRFRCMNCGQYGNEIHEMVGGGMRGVTYGDPVFWLLLCGDFQRGCHTKVQGWEKPEQLALKRRADPENYDLRRFNEVYFRTVTAAEVEAVR